MKADLSPEAAWLAQFVIDKHGGTDDLPAWVAQSARFWNELSAERDRLLALINTPETDNFLEGVRLEAAHQTQRGRDEQDVKKQNEDWFWVIGYLAGKALRHSNAGDLVKARHHCISTAAVLMKWHASLERTCS